MKSILVTILVMILLSGAAYAHDWYTGTANRAGQLCCSGYDCAIVPGALIEETRGGFRVVLEPGQHPMVTRRVEHFIPYREMMASPDGKFHLCLFPTQDNPRCFFGPVGGS